MLNLLPPECRGFLPVSHSGLDGAGHDRTDTAEVVAAADQPGIDDGGVADVFHAHGAVRFPRLLERRPDTLRRTAVAAVHRAGLVDAIAVCGRRDFLNV